LVLENVVANEGGQSFQVLPILDIEVSIEGKENFEFRRREDTF
jgi:hypothetical protein